MIGDNPQDESKNNQIKKEDVDLIYKDKDIITTVTEVNTKGNIEDVWKSFYTEEDFMDFTVDNKGDNIKLTTYRYKPQDEPKAVVIYFHGMGGYMKTSAYLAKKLSESGFVVVGFDYRGHGKSGGKRIYFDNLEVFIGDGFEFVKKVQNLYPNLPLFIGGSSLGGYISYQLSLREPKHYKAVFLFAPALKAIQGCCIQTMCMCLGSLCPGCELTNGDISNSTRNAYAIEKVSNDQYLNYGKTPIASLKAMLVAMKPCETTFDAYCSDFVMFVGQNEKIVDYDAITQLVNRAKSQVKKLYIYENMYHNILFEDECFDVIDKLINFLKTRIN